MKITLSETASKESEKLVPILLDADEDEERIHITLADEKNTSYAALKDGELVGAVTVKWEEQESEILYIAVTQKLRGHGYGKSIIELLIDEMRCRGAHSLLVGTSIRNAASAYIRYGRTSSIIFSRLSGKMV